MGFKLHELRYVIEHIEGPLNVWADMISRWAGQPASAIRICRFTVRKRKSPKPAVEISALRSLDSEGFVWPTMANIHEAQASHPERKQSTVDTDGTIKRIL